MSEYNVKTYPGLVRELIAEALSDNQIRQICFDFYRPLYLELAPAMSTAECIRRLVNWCYQQRKIEDLLLHIRELNETLYKSYLPRLEQFKEEDKYPQISFAEIESPLLPCIIHPLPPAPSFIGRFNELKALQLFWSGDKPGVLALIGLGGAGKTAITSEFLDRIQTSPENPATGLFVWSFYVNQDVNAFLEAAYYYFSRGKAVQGSGAGTFYLLIDLLGRGNQYLIVLDGLERVQRPQNDGTGFFGDFTDPLLSQIVVRIAAGLGRTKCIITSRFPIPKLESWHGRTYNALNIDELKTEDARLLLRRHQIKGNDATLNEIIEDYGSHALTLDHLGGYLREYHNGEPAFAKTLPHPEVTSTNPQEYRLARVLHAYDNALTEREYTLLSRLSVFRFGTSLEKLHSIFSEGDNLEITGPLQGLTIRNFNDILKRLVRLHLVLPESENQYTAHPAIRDHFYKGFTNPKLLHQAIRHHFSSLVSIPGNRLPEDEETINNLEELIYHTLQSGNIAEAVEIYIARLGSYIHLAWNLGQYSRCIRILNGFPKCPDISGLIWCYRAVGDLNAMLLLIDPDDTWWLSMIGCLRGHFKDVIDLLSFNRQDPIYIIAQFLTGLIDVESLSKAPIWIGLPISPAECYLFVNQIDKAREYVTAFLDELDHLANSTTWRDEIARYDLIKAEIERRSGNLRGCENLLKNVTEWVVQSGSQEHLCLLHLSKARLAMDERQFDLAESSIKEGLHIAEMCGFDKYFIELFIEQSKLCISTGKINDAAKAASSALNGVIKLTREVAPKPNLPEADLLFIGSNHPKCQFVWGSVRASFLYGKSLLLLDKMTEAREQFEKTLVLQNQINDPEALNTKNLIISIE